MTRPRLRVELRPGAGTSLIAILAGAAVTIHLNVWAQGAAGLVGVVSALALIAHLFGVVAGLGPAIGLAVVLTVGAATIVVAAPEPDATWLGAAIGALLTYIAAEAGWEAIERRDASRRTHTAARYWFGQRILVVAAALAVAVMAALGDGGAPVRTILIQGIVAIGAVAGLVACIGRFDAPPGSPPTDN